nr:putative g-type lectin s-receptor-like serine/threonine-protein kinase [Quercus suber]
MKLGWDSVSGLDRYLTPWKSAEDPAPSEISGGLDHRGLPQLVFMKGDKIKVRLGSWNGLRFTGIPWLSLIPLSSHEFVMNEKEIYYEWKVLNNSVFHRASTTLDTITPSQFIRDGETLVSASRFFELGFFSPDSSKSRYVGIWFVVSNDTVVWVANRETPLENHHGVLKVTNEGILVLLDSTNTTIWSSNTSRTAGNKINNPTARLLDSGNLVVKDGNIESFVAKF